MTVNGFDADRERAAIAARHMRNLALAIQSARLEGGKVSDEFLYEARDYANGLIDAATLGRRVRARYGIHTE